MKLHNYPDKFQELFSVTAHTGRNVYSKVEIPSANAIQAPSNAFPRTSI